MDLEPVLLETSLAAVFDGLSLALRAGVVGDELLFEIVVRFVTSEFEDLFERAHLVFALAHVDHLFVRWSDWSLS